MQIDAPAFGAVPAGAFWLRLDMDAAIRPVLAAGDTAMKGTKITEFASSWCQGIADSLPSCCHANQTAANLGTLLSF
jgi:hypothetical protein